MYEFDGVHFSAAWHGCVCAIQGVDYAVSLFTIVTYAYVRYVDCASVFDCAFDCVY